jgi:hypothetical protein
MEDDYWNCDCKNNRIHPRSVKYCPLCNMDISEADTASFDDIFNSELPVSGFSYEDGFGSNINWVMRNYLSERRKTPYDLLRDILKD